MADSAQTFSPTFLNVAGGLVSLHDLIAAESDDSPEGEAIRDSLDEPLRLLRSVEKERAQWLSEDLYTINEPLADADRREMNPQAQQHLNEAIEAREQKEWDRALAILRRWGRNLAPELLSYLRGSIWLEAGCFPAAAVFYKHAADLAPNNANYFAVYLYALKGADPDKTKREAESVLARADDFQGVVIARAANIVVNATRGRTDVKSGAVVRTLIPVLERTVARVEADQDAPSRSSTLAMSLALLGFCHEFLGSTGYAVEYYNRALRDDPSNDVLLVARGILLYGTSPGAVSDFELAIRLRSPVLWPYFFLAHHYLVTNRFGECLLMCEVGLRNSGSGAAMSQLLEWRAICQSELGYGDWHPIGSPATLVEVFPSRTPWRFCFRRGGSPLVSHPGSQQFHPGPAVHLPFDALQPAHLPFHLPIAPRLGQRRLYGRRVRPQAGRQVRQVPVARRRRPRHPVR